MSLKTLSLTLILALSCLSADEPRHVYLKAPNLSPDKVIGTNVGVRPYRKSGFRIEKEMLDDKLVIHNYGFGGSGFTFCFGATERVLSLLKESNAKTVAVLGSGVIGLSTAYDLMEKGYQVNIYSDSHSPYNASAVGVGIWSPPFISDSAPEEFKRDILGLLATSRKRYVQCATSTHPEFEGVRFVDIYRFYFGPDTKTKKFAKDPETVESPVWVHLDNGVVKEGFYKRELAIDAKIFLADLTAKVTARGAHFIQQHFNSKDDVMKLDESVIINCMSMGSREVFNDKELYPARGQLVYLQRDKDTDYVLAQNVPDPSDYFVTIYPWADSWVIGGIWQKDVENYVVDPAVTDNLLKNAQDCVNGTLEKR